MRAKHTSHFRSMKYPRCVLLLVAALLALAQAKSAPIPVAAATDAHTHDLSVARFALDALNAHLATAHAMQTFSTPDVTPEAAKEWTLTTTDGATLVVQVDNDGDAAQQLHAAWSVEADGSRKMVYHVKALPSSSAWVLGLGVLFVALGVIVVMSSKPSSIARAREPPSSPKGSSSPPASAASAVRRRRSKLD
ncbi:hypothetical protein SDRG_12084 [Saprolegnia diclina VS20]|uniref:Transmembrane protein n=1 Tax=Saprolegnia diclina (strain VS20) TaxID=1156394 RepID=T0PXH2_SAPDV|nr:hypothetical protein SDRG_12084 [Saprolegnia diclina VS20]EQC30234.1 hypothetical protein SDRG_12084 [Saprolegnia diclina VS20]|eukprot:XP_008616366.1 hypothetical protein SDRG_12084 [Saprolegnia diclina VS20]